MTPGLNILLAALQDGPFERPFWQSFLAALQAETDARYAGIFFRPTDTPKHSSVHLYSASDASPGLQAFLARGIRDDDPLMYFGMEEGRVYRLDELIDPGNPEHRLFLDEYLAPGGFVKSRVVRVMEPSGVNAWLSVSRVEPDFPKRTAKLLEFLVPHFRRALRSHIALEREHFRADVASEAIRRLDFGWLSLDADGRIAEISAHAEGLLRRGVGKGRKVGSKLRLSREEVTRQLGAVLLEFAKNPSAQPRALRLNEDPWLEALLVPAQGRPSVTAQRPVAIAYLHGDNRPATDRQRQIVELFGLLPSEARMALALGRGLTIAEAAESLDITIATARSYSKQIYTKMGARGQADVVRFLMASVLALT